MPEVVCSCRIVGGRAGEEPSEEMLHLYRHWDKTCPRCKSAMTVFKGKSGANEFSPRKSYRRFLRQHKTTRKAGRQVRRGLKGALGYAYRKL
jgi:hypothetical protein